MLWIRVVLAGLSGVMASEGLPTHTSTVSDSVPGVSVQSASNLRWTVIETGLATPGSALSAPDVGPVSLMSGLSHQTPLLSCTPPSPVTASKKMQVSEARAGSFGIMPLFKLYWDDSSPKS